MAGITLAQAQAKLTEWMAADTAVSLGQAYDMAGRSLTRADARTIRENIQFWDEKVRTLTPRSGAAVNIGIPRRDY